MQLIPVFIEGFENCIDPASFQSRYALGTSMTPAVGRKGFGRAYSFSVASSTETLKPSLLNISQDIVTLGFGLKTDSNSGGMVCAFMDGTTDQIKLNLVKVTSSTYKLSVRRNLNILAETEEVYSDGNWYYIELSAKIHNTEGFFELRVDQVPVLSASDVDTDRTSSGIVDSFKLVARNAAGSTSFDDVYFAYLDYDSYDKIEPTFYGDLSVEEYLLDEDYEVSWEPIGAATNEECVDEDISDADSTYNRKGVTGYDMFSIQHSSSWPHVSRILALQSTKLARLEVASGTENLGLRYYDEQSEVGYDSNPHALVRNTYEEFYTLMRAAGLSPVIECQHIENMKLGYNRV